MDIRFDFNAYSALLLPAVIHGFLFASLSMNAFWKERRLHDLFLGLLLLLLTIRLSFWMLGFAGWYDTHNGLTTLMFYFPFNTLIFIGPCLFFYFLSLTNRNFKFNNNYLGHLVLPGLLVIFYILKFVVDFTVYHPFPYNEASQFGTHGPMAQLDKSNLVYIVSYLSIGYYSWLILVRFKQYHLYLMQQFSDITPLNLVWLKRLLIYTVVVLGMMFVFYASGCFFPHLSYSFNWYPYFILGLAIYYIGVNGYYNSPQLYRNLNFEPAAEAQDILSPGNISTQLPDLQGWKIRVQHIMETGQPYLDAELSLANLAKQLKTSPQVLSKVINEGFELNFNDYINYLRVQEVITQLNSGAHLRFSLMGIAYDCGFNSKTTFNRAFKKVTGKTPSAHIQTI